MASNPAQELRDLMETTLSRAFTGSHDLKYPAESLLEKHPEIAPIMVEYFRKTPDKVFWKETLGVLILYYDRTPHRDVLDYVAAFDPVVLDDVQTDEGLRHYKDAFKPLAPGSDQGMTIIEILIVIALIGTIMTVLVGKLLDKGDDARQQLAIVAMSGAVKGGLDLYRLKSGRYPTTDEGLQALIEAPVTAKNWSGPYIETSQMNDPWGNPFRYESSSAKTFKITSVGADGEEGTGDDVVYPPEADKAKGEAPVTAELQVPDGNLNKSAD